MSIKVTPEMKLQTLFDHWLDRMLNLKSRDHSKQLVDFLRRSDVEVPKDLEQWLLDDIKKLSGVKRGK